MSFSEDLKRWQSQGRKKKVLDQEVFYLDTNPGNQVKPVLLVLHGYPSASYDFHRALPYLEKSFRVVIHDHPGFGFSAKNMQYSFSLKDQAQIALQLWQELDIHEAFLVAHDYGTSVYTEIEALYQEDPGLEEKMKLQAIVLSNGSIHLDLAKPRKIQWALASRTWGRLVARLSSRFIFKRNMRALWVSQAADDDDLNDLWALLNYNDGRKTFHLVSRYLHERIRFKNRWVGALKNSSRKSLILWAREDPVARARVGEELHQNIKGSELKWIDNCGHYPMLEKPEVWAKEIVRFLLQ